MLCSDEAFLLRLSLTGAKAVIRKIYRENGMRMICQEVESVLHHVTEQEIPLMKVSCDFANTKK